MLKLQIGAGLDGPEDWLNVDASPTLALQRLPLVGAVARRFIRPRFSPRICYGDVVRGLDLADNSVDLVYSSHVLEHLAFDELRVALREILRVLRPGGTFRSVMPDLEAEVAAYIKSDAIDRASDFMRATLLGQESRPRRLVERVRHVVGNGQHLWLWDFGSIKEHLNNTGFIDTRRATYGDSSRPEFRVVENPTRWRGCVGFETRKHRERDASEA